MIRIGILGDFNASNDTHLATSKAFDHIGKHLSEDLLYEWVATERISSDFASITEKYDGFLFAPGSPYKDMNAVLRVIQYARENKIPALGTCGGFQHMVIEFARNVLDIKDAQHAEEDPYASTLVINPLSCSLYGKALEIEIIDEGARCYSAFNSRNITENYYCNFGLNPEYQQQLHDAGFRIVASDIHKEARIIELDDHPFFMGTLFVPQVNSRSEKPHPIILEFGKAVCESAVLSQ